MSSYRTSRMVGREASQEVRNLGKVLGWISYEYCDREDPGLRGSKFFDYDGLSNIRFLCFIEEDDACLVRGNFVNCMMKCVRGGDQGDQSGLPAKFFLSHCENFARVE